MSDPAYIDHLNHEALESYDRLAEQGPDWDDLIADDGRARCKCGQELYEDGHCPDGGAWCG